MVEETEKIRQRDNKLLKNEKSWRRARVGASIIAVIWVFVTYIMWKQEEQKQVLYYAIGWLLFWGVLIDWLNMRIEHIKSIKYYRSEKFRE